MGTVWLYSGDSQAEKVVLTIRILDVGLNMTFSLVFILHKIATAHILRMKPTNIIIFTERSLAEESQGTVFFYCLYNCWFEQENCMRLHCKRRMLLQSKQLMFFFNLFLSNCDDSVSTFFLIRILLLFEYLFTKILVRLTYLLH